MELNKVSFDFQVLFFIFKYYVQANQLVGLSLIANRSLPSETRRVIFGAVVHVSDDKIVGKTRFHVFVAPVNA